MLPCRLQESAPVAETCCNIAMSLSQAGNVKKAMQMYERALRIYEKSNGANSFEVAHTLTDLAVLHLEQARTC